VSLSHLEQHGLDVEGLDRLAVLLAHAEALAVELDRDVEVLNGHAYVVDSPEHGRTLY
jgi:hypothetical protein